MTFASRVAAEAAVGAAVGTELATGSAAGSLATRLFGLTVSLVERNLPIFKHNTIQSNYLLTSGEIETVGS